MTVKPFHVKFYTNLSICLLYLHICLKECWHFSPLLSLLSVSVMHILHLYLLAACLVKCSFVESSAICSRSSLSSLQLLNYLLLCVCLLLILSSPSISHAVDNCLTILEKSHQEAPPFMEICMYMSPPPWLGMAF